MIPVVDSNLRPDALVDQVLCHYALPRVTRCRLHARGLNDTYRVETFSGQVFYLRVYRAGWRTLAEIKTELDVLRHLSSLQVSVCAPLPRIDGEVLTATQCPEGTRWACLFTAASGHELERKFYTEDQAQLYGRAAAQIHAAADLYEGPAHRPALDLDHLLDRPLALVSAAIAHRAADLSYLADVGGRSSERIRRSEALTIDFCHGDLHGRNAGFENDVFTFYDFDCCGWGYRAYDLAVFPWGFAVDESAPDRTESMARAFLRGYQSHQPLSAVDASAIPAFVAIRQIWLMGLHLDLADRFGSGWLNDSYFDRSIAILHRWDETYLRRPDADWLLQD